LSVLTIDRNNRFAIKQMQMNRKLNGFDAFTIEMI